MSPDLVYKYPAALLLDATIDQVGELTLLNLDQALDRVLGQDDTIALPREQDGTIALPRDQDRTSDLLQRLIDQTGLLC